MANWSELWILCTQSISSNRNETLCCRPLPFRGRLLHLLLSPFYSFFPPPFFSTFLVSFSMARGGGCRNTRHGHVQTNLHLGWHDGNSSPLFRTTFLGGLGRIVAVQNVMLSEQLPSFFLSFFLFRRPCPCEVSQGHCTTMLWILAQIGSRWGSGDRGVEEGVYDWEFVEVTCAKWWCSWCQLRGSIPMRSSSSISDRGGREKKIVEK